MFKNIYMHRVSQSIELMVADAMYEANHKYKFHQIPYDIN